MIELKSCIKTYTTDQDKAIAPEDTVARVRKLLEDYGNDILAETRRIDTGRLDIPVFLSITGPGARKVMPTRKQMGKGASPIQAEASALMELTERFSYFSFWDDYGDFTTATWSEALDKWPGKVMDITQIIKAAGDDISAANAVRILDLVQWKFTPVTNISQGREEYIPLDLFKKLNEFNGSSAGNTYEESIAQGAAELIERHVCAVTDRTTPEMPTIDLDAVEDPVLARLLACFRDNGLKVWLKDMTLGFPAPTVAAIAYDPATFPEKSEIVYTAGTASSPAKAAIRALTEVAQLGGDFETGANYEASGLPKYLAVEDFKWLTEGPVVPLSSLPTLESDDILDELMGLTRGLTAMGYTLYSVATTHPELGIPANYNLVPGFLFRERTERASLGMFVGRILAEDMPVPVAEKSLDILEEIYPDAHFMPFYRAMVALKGGDMPLATELFAMAEPLQDDSEDKGLAAFYQAFALTQAGDFETALPHLDRAISFSDEVKEYFNLRGVSHFKSGRYETAAKDFKAALDLDSGSAMDLANLGLCYKFLGQTEEALHCLANALQLDADLDFAREHIEELLGS
ncbi:YcaO-like family protein [Desulfovibrio ferrophilus]|uniref:TPR domain-containing protein n=1 Tax=Desulfovibrio ferrophilus TaxID=241368 RepID=A0A2Z6AUV2_9BACT|nr:YcaO-like family protein [Desulfovibrio ferrophilus]BBD06975.1 TPR domain-containing protein [Desulfovibrio ferrophilus]